MRVHADIYEQIIKGIKPNEYIPVSSGIKAIYAK